MGDDGEPGRLDAPGRLRARRAARRRGDDDARDLPVAAARVVLYTSQGCHLCEKARAVLVESGEPFEEVDITRDPQLEAAYREWLPVVEINGKRAFVYFVDLAAFRRKIAAQS